MDISIMIEKLVPNAQYLGSTSGNTEKHYNKLNWLDSRPKPAWSEIKNAWLRHTIPKVYTPSEFFDLFTIEEWRSIKAASKINDDVEYWLDKLRVTQSVNTTDVNTISGIKQMVSSGLLTQKRADEILN